MSGERRHKAHFDAPNQRWVKSNKTIPYEIIYDVKCWKKIESNSLEKQSKELDDLLDRREEQRKFKNLIDNG